ncbi:hypothetical protein AAG570_002417 [Ranatra chinensis]|uniref:Solute carrier family 12 member 9 n=1 Tax=Ranatra chinensis TaxID=642074 RepID=A0ABD0Y7W3_9HEMI
MGCVKRSKKPEDGYIEFGQNTEFDVSPGRTLGTFAGVFSPVALSMFSTLLFLRVGFIVGNAGLLVTLLQFLIAYCILLFTVASICAISTNGAVEGGGAYFMISRTLGPDFGGSIGTLFFFANVVNSAFSIVGCTEGLLENFGPSGYLSWKGHELPDSDWWRFLYRTIFNSLNLVVCVIGSSMFAKTSAVILAIVCICLTSAIVSFFCVGPLDVAIPEVNTLVQNATYHVNGSYTGFLISTLKSNLYSNYSRDYTHENQMTGFSVVFGVLFSGVTGIMAGANMSGELKEPGKSIPRGTISAVLFTFMCYVLVVVLTAASTSHFLLVNNYNYMMPINLVPAFITVGLLTATFSASLSNLIGSSRVLEALAKDNIYGRLLTFVTEGTWRGNPLAAVFTSWALVQCFLLIRSLNVIAQINSVLFLLSYLATNLACLGLDLTSAPNFRPSFKYCTWHTALIGLIGTLVMMFVINPLFAIISIVLCLFLVLLLHLFSPSSQTADWGSISQALIFHQVRKYLLMLDSRKEHVKFWRPQILLLVGNPRSCCPLIDFVNDMKKSGLYVLGHVIVGKEFSNMKTDPTLEQHRHWLSLVDHLKVKAFVELTVARSLREGLHHLSHISGMGAMKPNTIVLGYRDDEPPSDFFLRSDSQYTTHNFDAAESNAVFPLRSSETSRQVDPDEYVFLIKDILRMHKNVCLCRHFQEFDKSTITKSRNYKYIDVWPVNFFDPSPEDPFDTKSLFMLQLACVISMVQGWKHLKLRVHLCEAQSSMNADMTEFSSRRPINSKFKYLLDSLRIKASINQVSARYIAFSGITGS